MFLRSAMILLADSHDVSLVKNIIVSGRPELILATYYVITER